ILPADHALALRPSLEWKDFHGERFVGFNSVTSIAPLLTRALAHSGVEPDEVQTADSIPAVGGMVAAGMGITAVPRLVVPLMNFTNLVEVPISPVVERELVLTHFAEAPLPKPVENFKQRLLAASRRGFSGIAGHPGPSATGRQRMPAPPTRPSRRRPSRRHNDGAPRPLCVRNGLGAPQLFRPGTLQAV